MVIIRLYFHIYNYFVAKPWNCIIYRQFIDVQNDNGYQRLTANSDENSGLQSIVCRYHRYGYSNDVPLQKFYLSNGCLVSGYQFRRIIQFERRPDSCNA